MGEIMKKLHVEIGCALIAACLLSGCAGTRSVVREYDASGNLLRECETSESLVASITESTKGKTVIVWQSGWTAYLSCSAATAEEPTPTFKMGAGKVDSGLISALPGTDWCGLPEVIAATRRELRVSPEGVAETSSGMDYQR